ncbi:MAG: DUF2793 domain-containing protein [Rhizobiaceae bacterium]
MESTANLSLPFILPSQAQKHVTHNESLQILDTLVQLSLKSRGHSAPPGEPEEGDRYLVGPEAEDEWFGQSGAIATFAEGGWSFANPRTGFLAFVEDEERLVVHLGGAFMDVVPTLETVALLGINASADATNRLSVSAPATLLTHEGGSHRLSVNKETPADTASLVFSSDFSARAEIGLAGSDDLSFKVSPDGSTFVEALSVAPSSGRVSFPKNLIAEAPLFNIFRDGGRFAGTPEPAAITVGTFAVPGWMALTNSASLISHGKFVFDSTSYGGANAAVHADIQQLMVLLVEASRRRYYPEFHVARLSSGSGTSASMTFPDTVTRYTQLHTRGYCRPARLTTSIYVKALEGDLGIPRDNSKRVFVDGSEVFASPVIADDGEWHHVCVLEGADFTQNWRYSYDSIRIYQRPGDVALIALPAMVPGELRLPVNVGQIPGITHW